jgi:two-component system OmpR family sensor kinase/two-component system sensor histidine kinase QseC
LLLTAIMWAISARTIYWDANRESEELFDGSLKESANLLMALGEHEILARQRNNEATVLGVADGPDVSYLDFQFWDRANRLIFRNADAPETRFVSPSQEGYSWATINGRTWRTYSVWNQTKQINLQVAEPLTHRNEITDAVAYRLTMYALVCLPLMAVLMWMLVGQLLRPIDRLSLSVAKRSLTNLDEVKTTDTPKEILPLVQGLNGLLARIRKAVDHERRFTADAAHELRTPLAAIRAHAQVADRARSADERREALADIISGVDRSTRVVNQLLVLARLDPDLGPVRSSSEFDLGCLLEAQIKQHLPMAGAKGIRLEYAPCSMNLHAIEENVSMLIRNLLDNAIRYTPSGQRVEASLAMLPQGVQLQVADSGPGVSPEMRERIFDRFFRITGSEETGAGLGLSIVRRIVESEGASISTGPGLDGRGVSFKVLFPAN